MANLKNIFIERGGQAIFLMGIRGVSLISKFVLTLFIARFMGFDTLGLYGLIVASTFLIPAFTGLGIMYMKSRESVTQTSEEIVSMLYYYSRLISLIYVVLIAGAIVTGYLKAEVWLFLAIIFVVLFEHINQDLYLLLLNLSKAISANILHFIRTAVWIVIFMIMAFVDPSLREIEILLLAWIFGGVFSLIGFFWVTKNWSWKKIPSFSPLFSWIREEFKSSRVVYSNVLMDTLGQYMNHFLVTFFLGLELTGVYVYFMQVMSALSNLLRTGVIQSARPKLVRAHKMLDEGFSKIYKTCLKNTVMTSVMMAIISLPTMYFITEIIVDKPLALEWFPIFLVNLIYFIILMAFEVEQLVLYSHHRDDLALKLSALNLIGLLILNVTLIPLFSLWGAVFTLLIVIIVRFVIQRSFVKVLMRDV